jgi:hypothetical protein
MRYFQKIADGVDTMPLLYALQRQPELWNQKRFRTTFERTPHAAVDDIWLRFSDDSKITDTASVMADGDCVWHPAIKALPQARSILLDLMRRLEAYALDRVIITRLAPGKTILPHADNEGSYVHDPDRQRHHVVIQGFPGSLYRTGDETVTMLTGQVWWFHALTEHEVINNSSEDRIHMLVDLRIMP